MNTNLLSEDLRFSVAQMLKRPLLSLTILTCLAIGFGPNLAIFSLINTMLLAPIDIEEVENLRSITKDREGFGASRDGAFSFPEFLRLRAQLVNRHEFIAENSAGAGILYITDEPVQVNVNAVSNNYFELLRVEALHGDLFGTDVDFIPGGKPEIALSHQFWEEYFGEDPNIVGASAFLNASLSEYKVVGVLPPSFIGTTNYNRADVYIPNEMAPDIFPQDPTILELEGRNTNFLFTRIESEEELVNLQAELDGYIEEAVRENDYYEGLRFAITEPIGVIEILLPPSISTPLSLGLLLFVGLILLLASSSVATLILSHASERRNEVAIRIANGATPGIIIRQLLTEGLVYVIVAGVIGWIMALWFAETLPEFVSGLVASLPFATFPSELAMDWRVVAYGILLALISTLVTSLLPAIQISKGELVSGLKEDIGQASSQKSTNKLRHFFVIVQFAICTIVLIMGFLSFQSLRQSAQLDLGFSYDSMLVFDYTPAQIGYTGEQAKEFTYSLVDSIEAIDGVRSVAITSNHHPFTIVNLLSNRSITPVMESGETGAMIATGIGDIGTGFFDALGVEFLDGRDFDLNDLERPRRDTLILNEAMAQDIWGHSDVVGNQFLAGPFSLEVIGVVNNYYSGSFSEETPRIFYPIRQDRYDDRMFIAVQTDGLTDELSESLRSAIRAQHERLLVDNLSPVSDGVQTALGPLKVISLFSAALGGLALFLTLVGVYGVNAYNVNLRRKEVGIKLSLGANPLLLHFKLIQSGLTLVVIGLTIGTTLSYLVNPLLTPILVNVNPRDVFAFVFVALFILIVTLVALSIPSWRITRMEPMNSLRYE